MVKGILGTGFAAALGAMTIGSEMSPSPVNAQERLYEAQASDARTSWGIGITFRAQYPYTVINSVMKGGPADQAGLCPGDIILAYERLAPGVHETHNTLGAYGGNQAIYRWNNAMNLWEAGGVIYLRNGPGRNDWVGMNVAPIPFGWENDREQIAPVCSN